MMPTMYFVILTKYGVYDSVSSTMGSTPLVAQKKTAENSGRTARLPLFFGVATRRNPRISAAHKGSTAVNSRQKQQKQRNLSPGAHRAAVAG
jgi:hypothetical protein